MGGSGDRRPYRAFLSLWLWSLTCLLLCYSPRFITCFVTVFATVIAITKDLADVEGDKKFGIETFSTRLGVRNVAFLGALALAKSTHVSYTLGTLFH